MKESTPTAGDFRLLYLINGLGPGGAERSLAELLPYYLMDGVRPLIVCLKHRQMGVESAVRELGCEVRFLPPGGIMSWARALKRMIAQEEVNLVHTTLFESDVVGRLAAAGTGVPVLSSLVNTSYDPVRLRDPNIRGSRLRMAKAVDGWTARRFTTHFHAITHAVKDSAVTALGLPSESITVIERGRDRERLGSPGPERRRASRNALGLREDQEVIVNVARQEYQKGQRYLLEAASLLAESRPELVVLISGREGHTTAELKELHERLHLEGRVRFLGDQTNVPDILAASDLFVFPSLYEGLGGAVIEAMALGLPVVASDIPALREVVEDGSNGLLVKPESGEALAAAIGRILADGAMASEFGVRSREIFEARFTIERSAKKMLRLYRRVGLGVGSRRPARTTAEDVPERNP